MIFDLKSHTLNGKKNCHDFFLTSTYLSHSVFYSSYVSVQRHDVIGIKKLRTYLLHVEYLRTSKNCISILYLCMEFSMKAKWKPTVCYQKWISLQHFSDLPEPKVQVSFCHSVQSVVRPSVVRECEWMYWCFTSHATIFQSCMRRHRCAGRLMKKLYLRSGSQRHRHFVGFFI